MARDEQLTVGFAGLEAPASARPAEAMRQIVSVRMPDALVDRLEHAARARGIAPSALIRSLVAAGLDRAWDPAELDVASEVGLLRRRIEALLARLEDRADAGDE